MEAHCHRDRSKNLRPAWVTQQVQDQLKEHLRVYFKVREKKGKRERDRKKEKEEAFLHQRKPAKESHRPRWIFPIILCFLISCFIAYRDQDPVPL